MCDVEYLTDGMRCVFFHHTVEFKQSHGENDSEYGQKEVAPPHDSNEYHQYVDDTCAGTCQ